MKIAIDKQAFTMAEKARELLAVLDKIHTNPPQYLTADEIEVIFEHAQKIRLQLSLLKK